MFTRAESDHYDHTIIQRRLDTLRALRRGHNAADIAYSLRAGLHRNLGGISNPLLFQYTKVGTKVMIQDYINEVVDQLFYLASQQCQSFPLMDKLVFFRETRHAFGRSALLLSGGATLTMYHLGVIKALFKVCVGRCWCSKRVALVQLFTGLCRLVGWFVVCC